MVAAFLHLYFNRERLGMDVDSISELILWCGLGVFLGGKLFFFFEDPVGYWNNMGHFLSHLGEWLCVLRFVFGDPAHFVLVVQEAGMGFLGSNG